MTPEKARAKAEELLREIGVEQYAMMEDDHSGKRDALARALLLAQAEALESAFGESGVIECPDGITPQGMTWCSTVLKREMDRISANAAALRQAAKEMK